MKSRPHKHQPSTTSRPLAHASLLLTLAAASGCDTLFEQYDGASPTATHPGAELNRDAGSADGRRELAAYVSFMDVLDSTDEQSWHTIFDHTLAAYQEDPTQERRLRLAFVMSRADKKSREGRITRNLLFDARRLLDEALKDPTPTPALVRKLAQMQLAELDARLALYDEMQSLRSQLAKAHQESQNAQRVRSEAEARMRRIDAALAEANAKLEAVMNIERNIGPAGKETFP